MQSIFDKIAQKQECPFCNQILTETKGLTFGYNRFCCFNCNEIFETSKYYDSLNFFEKKLFFSINDLCIAYSFLYPQKITMGNILEKDFKTYQVTARGFFDIPYFQLDSSNKEKLYNKLKTYLIFS